MRGTPLQTRFACEKSPARGSRGMVITNHPAASAAGAQMLLEGGNAVDAAVAALFALTVVEPMMVGILGGGLTHLRTPDGHHRIFDNLACAPKAARENLFQPVSSSIAERRLTLGRANELGALAIAVPGALAGWCQILAEYGRAPLDIVLGPAIRLAEQGFRVTPYLSTNITDHRAQLVADPGLARLLLPGGIPAAPGTQLRQPDYGHTLRLIARQGAEALHDGELGKALVTAIAQIGGLITSDDLQTYRVRMREPVLGSYRGHTVVGPPPPASSGVHITQMLNLLEAYDLRSLGFGSVTTCHLIAEVMAIAFADRALATADPDFIDVPVARLISRDYASELRARISTTVAGNWRAARVPLESADTTHVTVADAEGNVVASTQTLNGAFGACMMVPGTGMIANNYMYNFDPHPGGALSIAPGKRVFTSMAPMMLLKEGRLEAALGLPGGLRIFPSAMQTIINLVDHGMSLQEAVEAPRLFSEGDALEVEAGYTPDLDVALSAMGHQVKRVPRIAGGMNAIAFDSDGMMTGSACWRADGTPVAISGGLASAGVGFSAS